MKQKLLFVALFGIYTMSLWANPIDGTTAKTVALHFFLSNTDSELLKNVTEHDLILRYQSKGSSLNTQSQESTYFYIFNIHSTGFVIVAGDDAVLPILGYSDQGAFNTDEIPNVVAKWLEGYKNEIRYVIEQDIPASAEITAKWRDLKNGTTNNPKSSGVLGVDPLLKTKWNQSPYYNAQCPGGSVAGCTATAMAQVMKYWNYPATGSGFHSYFHPTYGTLSANFGNTTYDWASMPNVVSSPNDAVATFTYQVGVSVDMNYSPQVSYAYMISSQSPLTNCAEYALKTYFGYKNTMQGLQRANYSEAQWINLLKTELDASRPVLYAGWGTGGGHCFATDGYDNNNYFHFNWGWGGAYDGYFLINELNPAGIGTGGGNGGYNSSQQAIIGIQPPTGDPDYSLLLQNYVVPSSSTLYYSQAFNVSTNILNNGVNTFTGDYTAAIFDASYIFIDFVEILSGYTLQGGYAYNNNLIFSSPGLASMVPGNYYVGLYYRSTGGNWALVANNGNYSNFVPITVTNQTDIELYSDISITPGTVLTQGQPLSVNFNLINASNSTFLGDYSAGLYNADGSLAQTLGTLSELNGLPAGYVYSAPYLTYSTPSVMVDPGTYYLSVYHNANNTGWQLTGAGTFTNPVEVIVKTSSILPDVYESNDAVTQAYTLPLQFTNNNASINTVGTNCHISTDYDYFKIQLPAGYAYTITPRLHDSYNSGNGQTYSLDGLFSYSTDANNWSDAFDDQLPNSILINGGGTLYYHVAPYFAGETGTYLLDMTVSRTPSVAITHPQEATHIHVYPNPASEVLNIEFEGFPQEINHINVMNLQGQVILSQPNAKGTKSTILPLQTIPDGIYFLFLQTNDGSITRKIIVNR